MPLFIMRHGEASPALFNSQSTPEQSDRLRPLTSDGRKEVYQHINDQRAHLNNIDEIWASPFMRAQETALIAKNILEKPLTTHNGLHPGGRADHMIEAIQASEKTLLVVSHQPLVGIMVDQLAGAEPGRYRLSTASIAMIDAPIIAAGCGQLKWLHHGANLIQGSASA